MRWWIPSEWLYQICYHNEFRPVEQFRLRLKNKKWWLMHHSSKLNCFILRRCGCGPLPNKINSEKLIWCRILFYYFCAEFFFLFNGDDWNFTWNGSINEAYIRRNKVCFYQKKKIQLTRSNSHLTFHYKWFLLFLFWLEITFYFRFVDILKFNWMEAECIVQSFWYMSVELLLFKSI